MPPRFDLTTSHLQAIAELLMGTAYADGDYDGHEAEQIGETLRELVAGQSLPPEVTRHLAAFDIDDFHMESSCAPLLGLDTLTKLAILRCVSTIAEADGVHALAETEFIQQLAKALGLDPKDVSDLTVEVVELKQAPTPPPLPPDAT